MICFIVLYKEDGSWEVDNFPDYDSASLWQKKRGGYILQEYDPDRREVQVIPPVSLSND